MGKTLVVGVQFPNEKNMIINWCVEFICFISFWGLCFFAMVEIFYYVPKMQHQIQP
jgi:hypothetical protein